MTPKIFKQSRIRTVGYMFAALVGFAAFCFSAALGISLDEPWKWFWMVFACSFGILAIFHSAFVLRPMQLTLNSDGFVLSGGWNRLPRFVAWQDIDGPMSSYPIGRGQEVIEYNFVEGISKKNRSTGYNNFSPDASLPSVWRESGEQVADELNAYRERVLKENG